MPDAECTMQEIQIWLQIKHMTSAYQPYTGLVYDIPAFAIARLHESVDSIIM